MHEHSNNIHMKKLIVFPFLFLFCLTISAQQNNPENQKEFTIDECVNAFSAEKAKKTKVGYQYYFADADFVDGRTLKLSVVGPHLSTHAPHRHAMDEFYFILEGTAEVYLDGETRVIKPNTSFYCPPESEHGIRNVGDTELKYLVIKKEK